MPNYSIYISTCDGYSDCWNPFFILFKKFWSDYQGKIYLSSEYKDYECGLPGLVSMKICEQHNVPKNDRVSWSKLTRWALESIEEDIILFMQEDFFLKGRVQSDIIDSFYDLMKNHPDICCIHLTDQCGKGSVPSEYKHLDEMYLRRPYRISCQSALWRKSELLSVLRDRENAWEFEMFGSTRSAAIGHRYLQVSQDYVRLNQFEIIPYIFTGIIKGRWYKEVPALFKENGINLDLSLRGIYEPLPAKRSSLFERISILFRRAFNRLDIALLRLRNG